MSNPDTVFLKYISGNKVLGDKARQLRVMLDDVCGGTGRSAKLFGALTEAMTNVLHHAYPDDGEYSYKPLLGQWWMAASYNRSSRKLTVSFLDQGVGIPTTLPRTYPRLIIIDFLSKVGLIESDASLIKAAMQIGRTQTGLSHRGLGLIRNVRSFIEGATGGQLRILSSRGEYIYGASGSEQLKEFPRSIGGTLLQWEIVL